LAEREAVLEVVEDVFDDPMVRRGIGWTEEDDPDEAKAAIRELFDRRHADGWRLFEVRKEDQRVGLTGLGPTDRDEGRAWYAIYLLDRGRGLGREVTEAMIDHAREEGLEVLGAITWADNEASRGLLTSLGFELVREHEAKWARESALTWVELRRPVDQENA